MDDGLTYALFHPWWGWKHKPVQRAMLRAFAVHYADVADGRFRANQSAGRGPTDWAAVAAALGRTTQTLDRSSVGLQSPPLGCLAGVAAVLGTEPAAFLPPLAEWVAGAAVLLARPRPLTRPAGRTYAKAVLANPPRRYAVCSEEVRRFLAAHDPAVGQVAAVIGPLLAACVTAADRRDE